MKLILLSLLGLCFLTGAYFLTQPLIHSGSDNSETEILDLGSKANFVTQDFMQLHSKNQIPHYFLKLQNIQFSYHDPELKNLIPPNSLPFSTTPNGQYKLEVETFSAPEGSKKIVVLQMNIFDRKTQNKVYEISRNYEINQ